MSIVSLCYLNIIYPHAGGSILPSQKINNLTDNFMDSFETNGRNTLSEIAEKIGIKKNEIGNIIKILKEKNY